ncbi:sigma-70 family RNA polymerase sigma factor [Paenibacillus psychroresistens]|uniref:RNA polymerase sigma factor n=1 Tax=Paenibacillus psychroresistens TaxID=1778678 RepID=A0A6B8RM39_9BACL|nr:sigma-70 family RNA polymerase sigma factor [Paenibacillus psychroresistens]QGQ96496.1 sigma-70 family RNA polymerase sigma factor [Paenibacillus psychroresistens]
MINQQEDQELIKRAKNGDQAAFSDLVMKHRSKAVDWARSITHDSYLAEDIAQNAILRSYLHLESLEHPDRFLPWLRNIVRNQAIDVLRKNKRNNLYIHNSEINHTVDSDTPEVVTLHKEWMESISLLMESLPVRNRLIFEAHFFKQHSPDEIAEEFQMTISNVYNIISRSKIKLQELRFRKETTKYLQQKMARSLLTTQLLTIPSYRSAYSSMGHLLNELISNVNDNNYSLSDIMGFTGQAFRIQTTVDCGLSGSLIYDWGWVMERALIAFGFQTRSIGRPGRVLTPDILIEALDMIHLSIDRGMSVIVWNLVKSEFGVIYGYNDQLQQLTYRNAVEESLQISYEKLGRTLENPELFVGTFENSDRIEFSKTPNLIQALKTIMDHARGIEPGVAGYFTGIAAYDIWIEAFENGQAQPVGHAYQVSLLTEAREHAVRFLKSWEDHPLIQGNSEIILLWHDAMDHFQIVHELYVTLYPSYPYGMPGVQMDIREQTIDLLKKVKAVENNGIVALEKIYLQLIQKK